MVAGELREVAVVVVWGGACAAGVGAAVPVQPAPPQDLHKADA